MNPELQKCYDAFELLKEGKGTHEKCVGLPLADITFSKISQEAGHDAGYLKKKRPQHGALLSMLSLFLSELPKVSTMGKGAALQRQKDKANTAKEDTALMKLMLDESLGRELQLYHALKNAEDEVAKLKSELVKHSNVTRLPFTHKD